MTSVQTTERVLVYENEPIVGARMTSMFAVATFVFSLFLAGYVFTSMRWGGELAPVLSRAGWSSVIAVGGIAFLSWAWLHNRKVTQRIFHRAKGDVLVLEHPAIFGSATREVPMAALENANFHEGDTAGEERVNAPFVRLGVQHGRAFVVNLPGHIHRYDVFARMLQRAGFDPKDAIEKQSRVQQHG